MPCRVALQDHRTQAAVKRLYSDDLWKQTLNEAGMNASVDTLDSPIGRWSTLIFPDCLPERLETVTLVIEGATLYDGTLQSFSSIDASKFACSRQM